MEMTIVMSSFSSSSSSSIDEDIYIGEDCIGEDGEDVIIGVSAKFLI